METRPALAQQAPVMAREVKFHPADGGETRQNGKPEVRHEVMFGTVYECCGVLSLG